jgi:hypothetical protein
MLKPSLERIGVGIGGRIGRLGDGDSPYSGGKPRLFSPAGQILALSPTTSGQ